MTAETFHSCPTCGGRVLDGSLCPHCADQDSDTLDSAEGTDLRAVAALVPVVRCPTCDTAYVLRLPLLIVALDGTRAPAQFMYQPDCRHKLSDAAFVALTEAEQPELAFLPAFVPAVHLLEALSR